jgi:hypothetical protein
MDERRSIARQRTFKGGTIKFGPATIDCVVRNLSSLGANLSVESPIGIPERFDLVVSRDHSHPRRARVIWRTERRIAFALNKIPHHFASQQDLHVNKVTWAKVGKVGEPGRYMFRFGYVTVTTEDLEVWKQFPHAEFALVAKSSDEAGDEFALGAFDVGA